MSNPFLEQFLLPDTTEQGGSNTVSFDEFVKLGREQDILEVELPDHLMASDPCALLIAHEEAYIREWGYSPYAYLAEK